MEVIRLVFMECDPPFDVYGTALVDIQCLWKRPWTVESTHTLRKANQCADALVKRGVNKKGKLCNRHSPHDEVLNLLIQDAS